MCVCAASTLTSSLAVRCLDDVVVERFSVLGLVFNGGAGHPWNVGQTPGRGAGHWGAATLQKELAVVDDPGAFGESGGDADVGLVYVILSGVLLCFSLCSFSWPSNS